MKSGCFCRYSTPRASALIAAVLSHRQKLLGVVLLLTLVSLLAFAAPSALSNLSQPNLGPEMTPPSAELWKTELQVTPQEISVWYDAVLHRPGVNVGEPLTFSTRGDSRFSSVSPLNVKLSPPTPYTNFYPQAQIFGDLLLLQLLPMPTTDEDSVVAQQQQMTETVQLSFTLTPNENTPDGATTRYLPILPAGVTSIGSFYSSILFKNETRKQLGSFQLKTINGGSPSVGIQLTHEWISEGSDTRLILRSDRSIAAPEGLLLEFPQRQEGA